MFADEAEALFEIGEDVGLLGALARWLDRGKSSDACGRPKKSRRIEEHRHEKKEVRIGGVKAAEHASREAEADHRHQVIGRGADRVGFDQPVLGNKPRDSSRFGRQEVGVDGR